MNLLQNGELVAKIVSNAENADPAHERPLGILSHRSTYTMVLDLKGPFLVSKNAQYAIAEDGKADQSIAIISAIGHTLTYRHN